MRAFIEQLSWLAPVKKVDISLGDFNINTLSKEAYADVSNVLTEYTLTVSEATYMDESLLDHLYLMEQFSVHKHVKSAVKNIVKNPTVKNNFQIMMQ